MEYKEIKSNNVLFKYLSEEHYMNFMEWAFDIGLKIGDKKASEIPSHWNHKEKCPILNTDPMQESIVKMVCHYINETYKLK